MITYPITDRETRTFTFKTATETKRGVRWPEGDGNQLVNPSPGLVIMEEFFSPDPAFDPATQKLDAGQWIDDEPNEATTFVHSVILKTAEEQTAYSEEQEVEASLPELEARITAYATLKTTLDGITVQSNITDVVLRLQQVIGFLSDICQDMEKLLKVVKRRIR